MRERYSVIQIPENPRVESKPQSVLREDEMRRVFSSSVQVMREIAESYHVTLPEGLEDRLIVADGKTYRDLVASDSNNGSEVIGAGTVLQNRLCLLDYSSIKNESRRSKIKLENLLRSTGVHELWHSVSYFEIWQSESSLFNVEDSKMIDNFRRGGIMTCRPGSMTERDQGISLLNEGFTEYLTKKTLAKQGYKIGSTGYGLPLRIVETLIRETGEEPFFQAMFTKTGFRNLVTAVDTKYGRGAFKDIITVLYGDMQNMQLAHVYGYKKTKSEVERYIHDENFREIFRDPFI